MPDKTIIADKLQKIEESLQAEAEEPLPTPPGGNGSSGG